MSSIHVSAREPRASIGLGSYWSMPVAVVMTAPRLALNLTGTNPERTLDGGRAFGPLVPTTPGSPHLSSHNLTADKAVIL